MEVLMSRPRILRHRVSRIVVTAVVLAITVGSAIQLRKLRSANAVAPPLQMSMESTTGGVVTAAKPTISPPPPKTATPAVPAPLITQTPSIGSKGQNVIATVALSNATAPVLPKATPVLLPVLPAALPSSPAEPSVSASGNYSSVLTDANTRAKAGDLLGARDLLNNALNSGKLSTADSDAIKKQMSEFNQTLVFSPQKFPKDPLGGVYTVKSGDRLAAIGTAHAVPFELIMQLNRMTDAKKLRYGQTLKIINGPFHAIVTKSKFTMDLFLGAPGGPDSTYITTFSVGLGTDNSTPTGKWSIKNKVTHPVYFPPEGHQGPVLEANDPKNPLGNYWMGLEGTEGQAVGQQSYGIHGTIDPASIGKQSSMGCIRLKNEDVEQVYKMLVVDKSVVVVRD
jgi:LysM repeat protein